MTYSEIQRQFDFTVSGILLEMELAGLIYQKHYECYVPVEETVEEIVEEIKSKADAFLDEYGSHPSEPTLKERNDWYYQGTETVENKRKRRSKHDVFNEKWNALFADRDWIKANWHEFVMEYLVLMTSRKEHRDFASDYAVTKTKTGGYSMHWKIYKDIGLNNLSANTAYSWTMRNGLRNLAIEGTRMRIELCADESSVSKKPATVAAQLRAEFIRNN